MLWPGKVLFGVTVSFSKIVPASTAAGSTAMVVVPSPAPVIFERLPMTPPVTGDPGVASRGQNGQEWAHSEFLRPSVLLQGGNLLPSHEWKEFRPVRGAGPPAPG